MSETSKVIRCAAFRWEGVVVTDYKPDPALFKDVTRQTIVGEAPGEERCAILTRYFEVRPGGYSTLERHEHRHTVIVLRGRGTVRLGDEQHPIAPFDAVYVAPHTVHQFRAGGDEPLGFLCVVQRERDRPVPVNERPGTDAR
ncbi:MAG: cupin domain-containing protein [Gemmatimonadales bacterium]